MLRFALVAVFALLAVAATPAQAALRSGSIGWEAPATPPSLEPRPPETQVNEYIDTVAVAYEDQAGQLSFDVSIYDAAYWAHRLPEIFFSLGPVCTPSKTPDLVTAHASYEREQFTDEEGTHTSVYSEALLSRKGYEGQATGTITPNGHGFTVAFTHAALASLDLRCFNVRTSEQWVSEIDDFEYFDGYRPTTLTRSNATATFKAALGARYGAAWTTAGKRWAICPREEFFRDGFDGESPALALCMAQFRSAGRWRQVSASLEQTDSGPVMRRPWSRTWTRKWRRQPAKCLRQVDVRGVVYSNDRTCPALMVSDLSYAVAQGRSTRRAYWHGTNTAGFEKVARYRCKRGGRTITCMNGLGDAFRWKR